MCYTGIGEGRDGWSISVYEQPKLFNTAFPMIGGLD